MTEVPSQDTDEAAQAEALNYWGYLIHRSKKCPTERLDHLLRGIAECIGTTIDPHDSKDLKPTQLAKFYHHVGGNYDPLFLQIPDQSISFIYKSLGCLHSLQPGSNPDRDAFYAPTVPAMKPAGFVRWQTIQLLLGPEEHIPFIQRALLKFNVVDPFNGTPFPKLLPNEAFPSRPDPTMVAWHASVSNKLKIEMQKADPPLIDSNRSSDDFTESTGDGRADAASYFSNPFNKNSEGKPAIVRTITGAPARVKAGGKIMAETARQFVNPFLWSGGGSTTSVSNHRRSSSSEDRDHTPRARHSPHLRPRDAHDRRDRVYTPRSRSQSRNRDYNRESLDPDDSDLRQRPNTKTRRRSYEPTSTSHDYFRQRDGPDAGHGASAETAVPTATRPTPRRHDSSSPRTRPLSQTGHGTYPAESYKPLHHTYGNMSTSRHNARPVSDSMPYREARGYPRSQGYSSQNDEREMNGPAPSSYHGMHHTRRDSSGGAVGSGMLPPSATMPQRSKSTRMDMRPNFGRGASKLEGVSGRRYPKEAPWPT